MFFCHRWQLFIANDDFCARNVDLLFRVMTNSKSFPSYLPYICPSAGSVSDRAVYHSTIAVNINVSEFTCSVIWTIFVTTTDDKTVLHL